MTDPGMPRFKPFSKGTGTVTEGMESVHHRSYRRKGWPSRSTPSTSYSPCRRIGRSDAFSHGVRSNLGFMSKLGDTLV